MTPDQFIQDCAGKLAACYELLNWHWGPNISEKAGPHIYVPRAHDIYRVLRQIYDSGDSKVSTGGLFIEKNPDGSMEVGFTASATFEYEPPLPGQKEYDLVEKQQVIDRQNRLLDRIAKLGVDVQAEAHAMQEEESS